MSSSNSTTVAARSTIPSGPTTTTAVEGTVEATSGTFRGENFEQTAVFEIDGGAEFSEQPAPAPAPVLIQQAAPAPPAKVQVAAPQPTITKPAAPPAPKPQPAPEPKKEKKSCSLM